MVLLSMVISTFSPLLSSIGMSKFSCNIWLQSMSLFSKIASSLNRQGRTQFQTLQVGACVRIVLTLNTNIHFSQFLVRDWQSLASNQFGHEGMPPSFSCFAHHPLLELFILLFFRWLFFITISAFLHSLSGGQGYWNGLLKGPGIYLLVLVFRVFGMRR